MTSAIRPFVALLLFAGSALAHATDGLKAGLHRKLDGGWLVALNYTRAYGAAGPSDRLALAGARPAYLGAGRRALVLSAARSF